MGLVNELQFSLPCTEVFNNVRPGWFCSFFSYFFSSLWDTQQCSAVNHTALLRVHMPWSFQLPVSSVCELLCIFWVLSLEKFLGLLCWWLWESRLIPLLLTLHFPGHFLGGPASLCFLICLCCYSENSLAQEWIVSAKFIFWSLKLQNDCVWIKEVIKD